jgi:branched-subunit amino acid aminotransferase/4-amino-4-deoxychorismate lyase
LVNEGRVRSLPDHFERFGGWVAQLAPELAGSLTAFQAAVVATLPREGRWFPRLELHGEGGLQRLFLRVRSAPDAMSEVTLWTFPDADPRLSPVVKGPDLSLCQQIRRQAQMHGASEAVLVSADGFVVESALSALVWWRGDVLCAPSNDVPWLDSITRREVFAIASQMGIETRLELAPPEAIAGLELWLLSSLQGIKPVTAWIDQDSQPAAPVHAETFQKRLRMLETVLD